MDLKDVISVRKSTRSFIEEPLNEAGLNRVKDFIQTIQPLDESRDTEVRFALRDEVRRLMPWAAPHYALLFSPTDPKSLIEVGFRYQQLDLFLQSQSLGSCGLGFAKPKGRQDASLPFQVMIAFGQAKGSPHRPIGKLVRKELGEITDQLDARLETARIAPSATNRQPCYFVHDGADIHLFGQKGGYYRPFGTSRWLWIDLGIALSHLYLSQPAFTYRWLEEKPNKSGYVYAGTIRL